MSLLGKLAGAAVGFATGGRVRPNFSKPNPTLRRNIGSPARLPAGIGFGEQGFGLGNGGSDLGYADPSQGPVTTRKRGVLPWMTTDTTMGTGRGYHLNKTAYFTRGGGTSPYEQKTVFHPAGTVWVRNRRKHVGNTRALRHAFSRVRGFAHLARATISFVKHTRMKKHHRAG